MTYEANTIPVSKVLQKLELRLFRDSFLRILKINFARKYRKKFFWEKISASCYRYYYLYFREKHGSLSVSNLNGKKEKNSEIHYIDERNSVLLHS